MTVEGEVVGAVEKGFLILLGVGPDDDERVAERLADKVRKLRVFPDDAGKLNLSVEQAGGGCLVVSQFTLYGDLRSGNRRPSGADRPLRRADGRRAGQRRTHHVVA